MVELIPSQDAVMQILKRTGAFREGHFVYPNGHYATLFSNAPGFVITTRLACWLCTESEVSTREDISSQLPKVSVISPSSGGIPVAFGVRDALNAEQIYWAEQESGKRMFRQYVNQGEINPCIIVDDIIRSGNAIDETVELVNRSGRASSAAARS